MGGGELPITILAYIPYHGPPVLPGSSVPRCGVRNTDWSSPVGIAFCISQVPKRLWPILKYGNIADGDWRHRKRKRNKGIGCLMEKKEQSVNSK
jgi:hypothetical protein